MAMQNTRFSWFTEYCRAGNCYRLPKCVTPGDGYRGGLVTCDRIPPTLYQLQISWYAEAF